MKPYAFGKSVLADSENQEKAQGCPVRAVRSKNGPLHVFGNLSRYNVPSRAVSVQNIGIAPGRRRNTPEANATVRTDDDREMGGRTQRPPSPPSVRNGGSGFKMFAEGQGVTGMSSRKTMKEGIEMKSIEASISTARIPTGMMTGWSHVRI